MPLPEPREDEDHDEFIERCMSELSEEFPDEDQRYAVCESQWEQGDDEEDKAMKGKRFWDIKAAAQGVGEVYIYGDIVSDKWFESDVTAAGFAEELKGLGEINTLNIYINSYGGSVFQGQAIYSILRRHEAEKHVYIVGMAASIASLVAMAGDTVHAPANAMLMVHNPWGIAIGNAEDMRKEAEALDRIRDTMITAYMRKLDGKTEQAKLVELLDAETWLTAEEAAEYGFVDDVLEEKQIAASASPEWRRRYLARYQKMPDTVKSLLEGDSGSASEPGSPQSGELAKQAEDSLRKRIVEEGAKTRAELVRRFIVVR